MRSIEPRQPLFAPNRPRSPGRLARIFVTVTLAAVVLAFTPGARATDQHTAATIVYVQLAFLDKQRALNKCLAASPHRNTPCIRQKALSLATFAARQIKVIGAAMDGSERACVRTVASQEIAYLRIWRKGALLLYRSQRKQARRTFLQSLEIENAQEQIQPSCFTDVFSGP